jgi:hypothetical protein
VDEESSAGGDSRFSEMDRTCTDSGNGSTAQRPALLKLSKMKGGSNNMIHNLQKQLNKDYDRNWKEGLIKGQELVAIKMLKKGLPLELILETTDVPMEKLYKMQEEVLTSA